MEKISNNPLQEDHRIVLKKKIAKAYSAGMMITDYEQDILELRNLRRERISSLSTEKELRYQQLKNVMESCEVQVPSIMEYKEILELFGLPEAKIHSLLNHENAHANVAEQMESQTFEGFRIRFHKDKNGTMTIAPSIKTTIDLSFPEKQILEENIMITEAPLHYGDKLSSGDKEILKKDKEKYSRLA